MVEYERGAFALDFVMDTYALIVNVWHGYPPLWSSVLSAASTSGFSGGTSAQREDRPLEPVVGPQLSKA